MSIKKYVKRKVSKKEQDYYQEALSEIEHKLELGHITGTDALAENATPIEKMKWDICREILIFKKSMNFTSKKMGELMLVDKSRTSEILHYKIERFTLDRLLHCMLSLKGMNAIIDRKIEALFSALNDNEFAS